MADAAVKRHMEAMQRLLETGKHSDFEITCQNETFKVHKAIVCPQSKSFEKALTFAAGKEAEERKIYLPHDDAAMVGLLVQYFYKAEYDPIIADPMVPHFCNNDYYYQCDNKVVCPHHICGPETCGDDCFRFVCPICQSVLKGNGEQLVTHAKMYEIAEKYDVTGEKGLSAEKFKRVCSELWDDPSFPIAANLAFSTTPDKDMGLCSCEEKTILSNPSLWEKSEIEVLLSNSPGLALEVRYA
ncbi:BTB/POZ domain-containing protein [Paraphaeosphaeria minitans]|uniref:BTB/POZ domain-containing protein n=1 Tax=Paraphaeosphaeria minitans TaxID=565426 RepID=A0A9P6GDU4_9PLEO|nr:BTB/POZ domain-containing protein [Paraphaeosphaeria minitans]